VCTAAGREGINLQFARVLFNFDLPWNPMDVEQRIGRIHRYGQEYTAQVYNLVLSDTIEGRIYLLLCDKLTEIARTLGKVDEHGNVTEDLQGQILGQLSERLSYDQLYRDALSDPELKRTRQEIEAAMSNASEARTVVVELFQELDRFTLDDYEPLADIEGSKERIADFLQKAALSEGGTFDRVDNARFRLQTSSDSTPLLCTLDRDTAQEDDLLELIGIDHPITSRILTHWRELAPTRLGAAVDIELGHDAVLTIWQIQAYGKNPDSGRYQISLVLDLEGKRLAHLEKDIGGCMAGTAAEPHLTVAARKSLLSECIEPALQRELQHRGLAATTAGYSSQMLAWVDLQ
jgi:hypothetical protein